MASSDVTGSEASAVSLGIAGVGGYATTIRDLVRSSGAAPKLAGGLPGSGLALKAVCEPDVETHAEVLARLRGEGVAVWETFEQMLATPGLEAVWLPVPIALHRPFTEAALLAGKAVMVEKPVAATVDDVLAMMEAERAAGLAVAVGFQDVYDPTTLPLKRRLLEGAIGKIQSASVWGCWPRDTVYFQRSHWAGRVRLPDGPWVLDSPLNNAMAHFVNIALFLLGDDEASAAEPVMLEGGLYRAAEIENYDTVSARVHLRGGVPLSFLLTHACTTTHHPQLRIEGDRGSVTWEVDRIEINAGGAGTVLEREAYSREPMARRFAKYVRGVDDPDTAVATLATSLAHTRIVNALSEHVPVVAVPASAVDEVASPAGGRIRAIRGIEEAFAQAAAAGQLLHEGGRLAFVREPVAVDVAGYNHFGGVAEGTCV